MRFQVKEKSLIIIHLCCTLLLEIHHAFVLSVLKGGANPAPCHFIGFSTLLEQYGGIYVNQTLTVELIGAVDGKPYRKA